MIEALALFLYHTVGIMTVIQYNKVALLNFFQKHLKILLMVLYVSKTSNMSFFMECYQVFCEIVCIIQLGKVMKYQLDTINVKRFFLDLSEQKIRVNHLTLCLTIISS